MNILEIVILLLLLDLLLEVAAVVSITIVRTMKEISNKVIQQAHLMAMEVQVQQVQVLQAQTISVRLPLQLKMVISKFNTMAILRLLLVALSVK